MSTFRRLLLVCLATTTVTAAGCAVSPPRVAATNQGEQAYETTCAMVGHTLDCVLRDPAVP